MRVTVARDHSLFWEDGWGFFCVWVISHMGTVDSGNSWNMGCGSQLDEVAEEGMLTEQN